MVHALAEAQRVLKRGGTLIDLRPTTQNRQVEVELAGLRLRIGEIDSSHNLPEHAVADAALAAALASGALIAEHEERFEYITELDTAADLRAFAAELRRSVTPAALLRQAEQLTADTDSDYIIRIRRQMRIARYRQAALD